MTLGELPAFYLALALLSSSLRESAYAIPQIVVGLGSLTTLVGLKQHDPNTPVLIVTRDMDLVDPVENVYVLRAGMISNHRSQVR